MDSDRTRQLKATLAGDLSLKVVLSALAEGDRKKADEWYAKFLALRAFRQLPHVNQRIQILGSFFVDLMSLGQFDFLEDTLREMRRIERTLYNTIGQPYQIALDHARRVKETEQRLMGRREVIANLRRVSPTLPVPPETE